MNKEIEFLEEISIEVGKIQLEVSKLLKSHPDFRELYDKIDNLQHRKIKAKIIFLKKEEKNE